MYTSVGFDAGDYVYQYGANLVGWPKGNTVDLGNENTAIAGATYIGYAQSGINSRFASPGPFVTSTTYTGTTKTVGGIAVSPTVLSGAAFASGSVKCTTLTDGRIAYAYRTANATLVAAIYTAAGVLQGSVTTISTTASFTLRNFSMVALSDGGFIVGYYDSTANINTYARLNSSNAITVSGVTVFSGNNASFQVAANQNSYGFSHHPTDNGPSVQIRIYTMSTNTLTATIGLSGTATVWNTNIAGTNNNTFMVGVADTTQGFVVYNYNNAGTAANSFVTFVNGASIQAGGMMAACGTTESPTNPGAVAATFVYPNNAGNAVILRTFVAAGTSSIQGTSTTTAFSAANIALGSINNGGSVLVYRNGTTDLRYATYNGANVLQSTGALETGSTANVSIGASGIPGGSFAFAFGGVTTGFSTFASAYSAAYTNGVTILTSPISYTPAGGYYVLGIALTTAAAGTTGTVAINGPANLGSSYPVLTSNILFDYTGTAFTARSAINANRGNVIGTNVTLRGLE